MIIAPKAFSVSPEKLAQIPCPNLRTLVNEGWLTPDKDGLVDLEQLDSVLKRIGIEGLPKKLLVRGAERATHEAVAAQFGDMASGKFNIYRLTHSELDHPGDTRILRGGFNPERLDWLLSFADKDGRIGMPEVSRAQLEARNDELTTLLDKGLGVAELTAIVQVYATPDKHGNKTISAEGVRSLYQHARFPEEWRSRLAPDKTGALASPQKTGLMRLIGGIVSMAFRQLGTSTGRAHLGMDTALGREQPLNQTSGMGLTNSICPMGKQVAAMPRTEIDKTHENRPAP